MKPQSPSSVPAYPVSRISSSTVAYDAGGAALSNSRMPHEHGALATRIMAGDSISRRWRLECCTDRRRFAGDRTGTTIEVTRARAGWRYVHFAVRQIAPGKPWVHDTGAEECCLVLLAGHCQVSLRAATVAQREGRDRDDVARASPQRVCRLSARSLSAGPHMRFASTPTWRTELADGRAPSRTRMDPRQSFVPKIADSKFAAAATRRGRSSTSCRPGSRPIGCWCARFLRRRATGRAILRTSTIVDRPPGEVKLEEIYYYRFEHPDAYGMQRLYDRRSDRTVTVGHGDVVLIRSGYHPFVTAYGYNAYYLNVLAGTRRSMAASDDPVMRRFGPAAARSAVTTGL